MLVPDIEPFSCEVDTEGGVTRVFPSGELDLLTTPELQHRLAQLREAGHEAIVLDLHDVSFLDSTMLHLLVDWTQAARGDGFRFAVAPGSPRHARLFELCGIAGLLQLAS